MTDKNFPLTLEQCKIILDNIDGLIATDKDGKILYLSKDMRERIASINGEILPESVYGADLREIHPSSKLIPLINTARNTEERELAVYLTLGFINIARLQTMQNDNHTVVGYMDVDIFRNASELQELFDKLKNLSSGGLLDFENSIDLITTQDKRIKNIKYSIADIRGTSHEIAQLKKNIYTISEFESTVLIEAETGCGKELIAHSIHNLSKRRKNPLIEINCAAIPESLFESELFGYENGAFTGAQRGGKAGKLELAEKGTLFLDEIDQLPYHIQPKLLRVLQEQEFARIGGKTQPMDVRIIAASNKNLATLVKKGKFREDLYYRLNIFRLTVPPLRDRIEDIPVLTEHFITQMNHKLSKAIQGASPEVMKTFYHYAWPGNVRELKNVIERAMYLCNSDQITLQDLGDFITEAIQPQSDSSVFEYNNPLEKAKALVEAKVIQEALDICSGNKRKAAELLKISRATLYNKLEKLEKMSK